MDVEGAGHHEVLVSCNDRVDHNTCVMSVSVHLDGHVVHEGRCWASSCQISSSDENGVGSYVDVSGVISDQSTVNDELVERSWVDVQNNSPVAIESDVLSGLRKCIVGPLTGVAPHSGETFLDKEANWGRAVVPADDSVDIGVLPLGSVFAALADSEHSESSFLVVVEILSVFAGGRVELGVGCVDEIQRGHLLGSSDHGSHLEELSVFGVVEFEDNAIISRVESGRGEDGKMFEVDAGSPPDVVDFSGDEGQSPYLLLFFLCLLQGSDGVGFGSDKVCGCINRSHVVDVGQFCNFDVLVVEKLLISKVAKHDSSDGDGWSAHNCSVPVAYC